MRNKEFEKLTAAQKRVEVAKDVLEQLKTNQYTPNTGFYINIVSNCEESDDIQSHFSEVRRCEVCQIGAIILSVTRFRNKLTFGDVGTNMYYMNHDKINEILKGIFTADQLLLIEHAFEGYDPFADRYSIEGMDNDIDLTPQEIERITDFRSHYRKSNTLMRAIMENIIANKGTFKP